MIATDAKRDHVSLHELGAAPVAYGPGLAGRPRAAAPQGISAAVDFAGTDEALDVSLELVADRARIASIAEPPRRAEAGIKLLGYGPGQDAGTEIRDTARPPRRSIIWQTPLAVIGPPRTPSHSAVTQATLCLARSQPTFGGMRLAIGLGRGSPGCSMACHL